MSAVRGNGAAEARRILLEEDAIMEDDDIGVDAEARVNKSPVASDMRGRDASNAPALGVVRRSCCLAAEPATCGGDSDSPRDARIRRILCTYRIPWARSDETW